MRKNITKNLKLVKLVLILELIGLLLFTFFGGNFITLLIFTIFVSLFNSPYFTLQEGIGSYFSKRENKSYTGIRMTGSSGYLVALVVGAGLIKLFNENFKIIFVIAGVLYLICLLLWFTISKIENEDTKEEIAKIKFSEVFKNKTFILYFIAYLLIIGCHSIADTYHFARLSLNNIDPSTFSLVNAVCVLIEVVTMFCILKFVKEDKYFVVLKISVLFLFLREFFLGSNASLPFLIVFTSLRGLGWGGFLAAHVIVLRRIVSSKLLVKAISILTITQGLINGLVTIFGTSIYNVISIPYFYLLLSFVTLIGIIVLYTIKFKFEKVEE